jgi:hypothetical protein
MLGSTIGKLNGEDKTIRIDGDEADERTPLVEGKRAEVSVM